MGKKVRYLKSMESRFYAVVRSHKGSRKCLSGDTWVLSASHIKQFESCSSDDYVHIFVSFLQNTWCEIKQGD